MEMHVSICVQQLCINWMHQQSGNNHLPEIKLLSQEEIQKNISIGIYFYLFYCFL